MRLSTGIVLSIIGFVWLLQGLDVQGAPESFMTGNGLWLVIGGLTTVVGIAVVVSAVRRDRKE